KLITANLRSAIGFLDLTAVLLGGMGVARGLRSYGSSRVRIVNVQASSHVCTCPELSSEPPATRNRHEAVKHRSHSFSRCSFFFCFVSILRPPVCVYLLISFPLARCSRLDPSSSTSAFVSPRIHNAIPLGSNGGALSASPFQTLTV